MARCQTYSPGHHPPASFLSPFPAASPLAEPRAVAGSPATLLTLLLALAAAAAWAWAAASPGGACALQRVWPAGRQSLGGGGGNWPTTGETVHVACTSNGSPYVNYQASGTGGTGGCAASSMRRCTARQGRLALGLELRGLQCLRCSPPAPAQQPAGLAYRHPPPPLTPPQHHHHTDAGAVRHVPPGSPPAWRRRHGRLHAHSAPHRRRCSVAVCAHLPGRAAPPGWAAGCSNDEGAALLQPRAC